MNWRSVDLNLFVVFDAVARERSITRAAQGLNMSQSAVSHALGRLRRALGDDLFVRTSDGMEPTPYADTLTEPIRATLTVFRRVLAQASTFDPATSDFVFRVAVDNCNAVVLAPELAARAAAQAPGVTLDLRPSGVIDILDRLERGELDLAIGGMADPSGRLHGEPLFDDGFAAVARRAHPGAQDGEITLEALGNYPHLSLSSTGEDDRFVDIELERHHMVRHVAARAPLLSAAALLTRSDLITVVSERTARAFVGETPGLAVLRLPFVPPRTATAMLWHRRVDDVPAHRWLRGLVRTTADGI